MPLATPSPAFHPALRDLITLYSILQPSISIIVTSIPPLHPQTAEEFRPTWSSPVLLAPYPASHSAFSDPNSSPSPPVSPDPCIPTLLLPSPSLPAPVRSPAHRGPACLPAGAEPGRDRQSGGRELGLEVPHRSLAHPLGLQLPACASRGTSGTAVFYEFVGAETSRRPQLSQPRKSLHSPGDGLPRQLAPRVPQVRLVLGGPCPRAHLRPPPPPRAGRGKGDLGKFDKLLSPPPSRPPDEHPDRRSMLVPQEPHPAATEPPGH